MFVKRFKNNHSAKNVGLKNERGAALAFAVIITAILAVVALTALAFSSTEARIAGSDLRRTQTFYAAESGMEKMTNDFSNLFRTKLYPTATDLYTIANSPPAPLLTEGFTFQQTLEEDTETLTELREIQGLPNTVFPRVNIPEGPYSGLYASVLPYKMSSTATMTSTRAQVKLEREFNNYLVPLFQFGIFSSEDLEFAPGPAMTFNGRIHSNANIYALRNIKFLNRLSMAGEFVRNSTRSGEPNNMTGADQVFVDVSGINVQSTVGSVQAGNGTVGGPYILGSTNGQRGYFPGSPTGIANPNWETLSVRSPVAGTPNRFGGQVLTNTTGADQLKTPLELSGNSPAEIIKRKLPTDTQVLATSRYHNKSQVRILIDDETAGNGAGNVAGITGGVLLSTFMPSILGGGNALRPVANDGTVGGTAVRQRNPNNSVSPNAVTVRTVKKVVPAVNVNYIPGGSDIKGKILIEIVKPDGTTVDVTQTILSMGVTEGEPNGIVYLQRPLWASIVQGSRDRSGNGFDLVSLTRSGSQPIADGEIQNPLAFMDASRNFISGLPGVVDDDGGSPVREADPGVSYNKIVPINVYNVREGWVRNTMAPKTVYYERGITSVVELNMRNLARWLDGVYDSNLLAGTNAVSTNVKGDEGYVVYISDRRGDRVKPEYLSDGTVYNSTNGTVDNEDIYGANGILEDGEDVIDFGWDSARGGASKKGTLQKDVSELPDTGNSWVVTDSNRLTIGTSAMNYVTPYFRRSVRLFDGDTLSISGAAGKLSPTKGITIATENMVYMWGNYNTTGITGIPLGGSTLNNGGYTGPQVPASIVADAFFPLSKTWYDGLSAMFPEGSSDAANQIGQAFRMADENITNTADSTSVRAGIIAGTTISAMTASPGRNAAGLRRSGGIINYPRFLELWNLNGEEKTWNYTGSFIPLYHSTQAISQWENDTAVIYMPPRRNWSFDSTFLSPNRLPPGTPFFQYVQSTGFRQSLR